MIGQEFKRFLRIRKKVELEPPYVSGVQANGTEQKGYVTHGLRNEPCAGKAAKTVNPIPAPVEEEGGSMPSRRSKGAVKKTAPGMKSGRNSKKGWAGTDKHRFFVCPDTNRRRTNCPCPKCRGKSLCRHDRQRHKCKDCLGTGFV